MRNELLKAALSVFLFWMAVLVAYDWYSDEFDVEIFVENFLVTPRFFVFGLLGGGAVLLFQKLVLKPVTWGDKKRGLSVSLGLTPKGPPLPEVPSEGAPAPEAIKDWLAKMDSSPKTAVFSALYRDLAGILYAKADHPSAVIVGGHGDVGLFDHTMHVVQGMLELAPEFQYTGLHYPGGSLAVPPSDPHFQFDAQDPLIPLVGIAHDLGKLECYGKNEDGSWVEVLKSHGTRSAQMLARIDSYWNLDAHDRNALYLAVSFYHHELNIPLNGGDRPRALIGLLLAGDGRAGRMESSGKSLPKTVPPPPKASATESAPSGTRGQVPKGAQQGNPEKPAKPVDINVEMSGTAFEKRLVEAFESLIHEPGRINGGDQSRRVGFKEGKLIAVCEETARKYLASFFGDPKLERAQKRGDGQYIMTSQLLRCLSKRGRLVSEYKGEQLSPERSLFKVKLIDPKTEKVVTYWVATILLRADQYPDLEGMADSKFPISWVEPRWGFRPKQSTEAIRSQIVSVEEHDEGEEGEESDENQDISSEVQNLPESTKASEEIGGGEVLNADQNDIPSNGTANCRNLVSMVETAILSLADKGLVRDNMVFVDALSISEAIGMKLEDIFIERDQLTVGGIVVRKGGNGGIWFGARLQETRK